MPRHFQSDIPSLFHVKLAHNLHHIAVVNTTARPCSNIVGIVVVVLFIFVAEITIIVFAVDLLDLGYAVPATYIDRPCCATSHSKLEAIVVHISNNNVARSNKFTYCNSHAEHIIPVTQEGFVDLHICSPDTSRWDQHQ